jgi:hypothetical protein
LQEAASGPRDSSATTAAAPAAAPAPPAPAKAPTKKVTLGMTVEEAKAALGEPTDIADMGAKKIYVFGPMKLTFTNGKLTSAQ